MKEEKTPEQQLAEHCAQLRQQMTEEWSSAYRYTIAREQLAGITKALEILGITVEGVTDVEPRN